MCISKSFYRHLKTMHHLDGSTIVRCHGGRERGAVGAREVQTIIVVAVVALHCVA